MDNSKSFYKQISAQFVAVFMSAALAALLAVIQTHIGSDLPICGEENLPVLAGGTGAVLKIAHSIVTAGRI